MKIQLCWSPRREEGVQELYSAEQLVKDLEGLLDMPLEKFCPEIVEVGRGAWPIMTFESSGIWAAVWLTDHAFHVLQKNRVMRVTRKFIGKEHGGLNLLLDRLDDVEEAIRVTAKEIKATRRFQMVPFLGGCLGDIRHRLERLLRGHHHRLPTL